MSRLLQSTIGEYRLVDFLGAGGMGEVYRAVHLRTGRVAALKVLTGEGDPVMVQRFLNEGRIQASLRHPNIAALYEVLQWEGRPVIAMECIDGQTLCESLEKRGPFALPETVAIMRTVAETVGYIHSQGIIHRDLKTNNIKINSSGQVKLLDFGIAKGPQDSRLTKTGYVLGTFQNLSPEQVQGQPATAASDIWALGVVGYEIATGRLPFLSEVPHELFSKILKAEFPAPSQVNPALPREFDAVVQRCLRKKPAERYASGADLAAELGRIAGGPATIPTPALGGKTWFAIGAGTVALILIVLILVLRSGDQLSPDPKQPPDPEPQNATDPQLKTITVDVIGGTADVFQDGRRLGATPYQIRRRFGSSVEVLLKREGYRDLPVQFDVSERHDYSYMMEPSKP